MPSFAPVDMETGPAAEVTSLGMIVEFGSERESIKEEKKSGG
jgi:hypothetical protein